MNSHMLFENNSQIGMIILGIYSASYMDAHVLFNLLNELRKRDKIRGLPNIYLFFVTSLNRSTNV